MRQNIYKDCATTMLEGTDYRPLDKAFSLVAMSIGQSTNQEKTKPMTKVRRKYGEIVGGMAEDLR